MATADQGSRKSSDRGSKSEKKKNALTMKYIVTRTIGKGAFGVVYLAMEEKTEKIYAIKETFQDAHYKNREAQIVKNLTHPNIIKVHHIFFSQKPRGTYLHLVMDHVPANLFEIIQKYKRSGNEFERSVITKYMYQACRGLGYIHKRGICHRDIKPQNILVDPTSNRLYLCDFGSAKMLIDREWNKTYICSRFYRAPELLFQSNYYTTAVDMWSLGCVFAEMFHLSPLFAAPDTDGQIAVIADVLGPVGRDHIKIFRLESSKVIPQKKVAWERVLGKNNKTVEISEGAQDLMSNLLTYDCVSRLQAYDGIKHPYFAGIQDMIKKDVAPECEFMKPTEDELSSE